MTSLVSHTSFDALDSYSQSEFWCQVLGYSEDPDDPNLPEHEECMIFSPDRTHRLLFIAVPDAKQVKNRVHLDLSPADGATRDSEVERLVALGATVLADRVRPNGSGWLTLGDPEGNEFCVLRSAAEIEAAHRAD